MATEHTPGPWHVEPAEVVDSVTGGAALPLMIAARSREAFRQWGLMGDYRGCQVAFVAANPFALEQPEKATIEANARLIAAAPDLLTVVERLYAVAIWHSGEVEACELCSLQQLAQSAIAKARGKASHGS